MVTFKQFLAERNHDILYVFDIDDTLLHTNARINVKHKGQVVKSLNNQEFNDHSLDPAHEYDFSEFEDADKFHNESKPIEPVITLLKNIDAQVKASRGGSRIIMNTARGDFNDKDTVLNTFKKYGINMDNIHIHRAGNIPGNALPAEKKLVYIRKYLYQHSYNAVHMYDDSRTNLKYFLSLQQEFPTTQFVAWLVSPQGDVTNFGE